MRSAHTHLIALAGALGCVALTAAPEASAAGSHTVCASGCNFTTIQAGVADSGVLDGDTLLVKAGTYSGPITVNKQLTIEGDPANPTRPVVTDATNGDTTINLTTKAGSTLTHLDVRATGNGGSVALGGSVAATLSDIAVTSVGACVSFPSSALTATSITITETGSPLRCMEAGSMSVLSGITMSGGSPTTGLFVGPGGSLMDSTVATGTTATAGGLNSVIRRDTLTAATTGLQAGQGTVVSDSVLTETAGGGAALSARASGVQVRNVTAIATGSGSHGLEAAASMFQGAPAGTLTAKNAIARGGSGGADVAAPAPGGCFPNPPCPNGSVQISQSNFATTAGPGTIDTSGGFNQSGDPKFVNGTVGPNQDFHLQAGSPAIGAGIADPPSTGTTDITGVVWAPFDMGAYHFPSQPGAPPSMPSNPVTPAPPQVGVPSPARNVSTIALPARTVLIDLSSGKGSLTVGCHAAARDECVVSGTLSVPAPKTKHPRRHKAAKRALVIGTIAGTIQGGRLGRLAIRLNARGRALLRTRHSIRSTLVATIRNRAGLTTQLNAALTLNAKPLHLRPQHRR